VPEAPLEDVGSGLAPAGDGWFVVNVRDAQWMTAENAENKPHARNQHPLVLSPRRRNGEADAAIVVQTAGSVCRPANRDGQSRAEDCRLSEAR